MTNCPNHVLLNLFCSSDVVPSEEHFIKFRNGLLNGFDEVLLSELFDKETIDYIHTYDVKIMKVEVPCLVHYKNEELQLDLQINMNVSFDPSTKEGLQYMLYSVNDYITSNLESSVIEKVEFTDE